MLQETIFAPGPIVAKVYVPGSKSMTNRALLIAALAEGTSEIRNLLISDDTLAFMDALKALGIALQWNKRTYTGWVLGGEGVFPNKKASIWCADSGTTSRFLLAATAGSPGIYQFDGSPTLRKRPLFPLLQALMALGARIVPDDARELPVMVAGTHGLEGGEIEVSANATGQFISALLMIAPYSKSTTVIVTKNPVSQPYIEMTCQVMNDFGVLVKRHHPERFSVPAPQRYQAQHYEIEPDLSTASYFFAAAAVTGGEVSIQPIDLQHTKQADAKFLNVLEKMGCTLISNAMETTIKGPDILHGAQVDMRDFSDTFMTLAAIAPFANSPTTITNIEHVRFKESDRIVAMRAGLLACGVQVEEGKDWLRIHPSSPHAATIDSYNDHRIAMAFSVLGLRVKNIRIQGAECVSKTCPEFFNLWRRSAGHS